MRSAARWLSAVCALCVALSWGPVAAAKPLGKRNNETHAPPLTRHERLTKITEDAYRIYDWNDDGSISVEELGRVLGWIGLDLKEDRLAKLLKAVDLDQDGKFTMAEFVSAMFDRVYDGEPASGTGSPAGASAGATTATSNGYSQEDALRKVFNIEDEGYKQAKRAVVETCATKHKKWVGEDYPGLLRFTDVAGYGYHIAGVEFKYPKGMIDIKYSNHCDDPVVYFYGEQSTLSSSPQPPQPHVQDTAADSNHKETDAPPVHHDVTGAFVVDTLDPKGMTEHDLIAQFVYRGLRAAFVGVKEL